MRIPRTWWLTYEFGCDSKACAPPPVGTGGSRKGSRPTFKTYNPNRRRGYKQPPAERAEAKEIAERGVGYAVHRLREAHNVLTYYLDKGYDVKNLATLGYTGPGTMSYLQHQALLTHQAVSDYQDAVDALYILGFKIRAKDFFDDDTRFKYEDWRRAKGLKKESPYY